MMTPLTHIGFFDGIGAFSLGLERAGFESIAYSEVKPYSVAVHESRFAGVPNLGDINVICKDGVGPRHEPWCPIRPATVWTGGFPCSDLSVMGKRKGLTDGDRSSLALVFLDLIDRHRPDWVVLENVPGLLSSAEGRDLGTLLGTVAELGYGWAYRLLDARNFGLPQSRRRVFVVAGPTANGAGAVLDEATPRGLAVEPLGGARRAIVEGSPRGADPDRGGVRTVVIGPTYSRGGDSRSISRANDTFPLTPSNEQYVVLPGADDDHPGPVAVYVSKYGPAARDDGSSYLVKPHAWSTEGQYVLDRRDDVGDVRGPGGGDRGRADGEGALGDGLHGEDRAGREPGGLPADDGAQDQPDGVRAASGVPGRLDDRDAGDGEAVWPQRLDASRWHVLGRTLPVPIAEWIGAGLRTVIEAMDADPFAYADE